MIPRYARKDMTELWSDRKKYETWLEIELAVCEAQAELGLIPAPAVAELRKKSRNARIDPERIDAIESEVRHDVIAFITSISEQVGEPARYMHLGLTSSDVLDTCLALQLSRASDILLTDLQGLLEALKKRAYEFKDTVCAGRSHGIHAEPTTFGLKLLSFYAEFERNHRRLKQAQQEIATCALSGAVGTFAHNPIEVEERVAKKLGLRPEPISTQIIPRDRHAQFFSCLAVIASSIEHLAVEIRHLQRTEVREAQEYFRPGQKGSSAMPHKRNPILSENLTGLARVVRSAVIPAMENVAQWHERDIAHSSVERVIAPDATIALDFALHRLTGIISKLQVFPERMRANLDSLTGLTASQRVLLALCDAGLSREEAYKIVQHHALRAWDEGVDFHKALSEDKDVTSRLSAKTLEDLFDLSYHTKNVDAIFARVFQES